MRGGPRGIARLGSTGGSRRLVCRSALLEDESDGESAREAAAKRAVPGAKPGSSKSWQETTASAAAVAALLDSAAGATAIGSSGAEKATTAFASSAAATGGSATAGAAGGAATGGASAAGPAAAAVGEFCIIEGPDALQDFARMQLTEIRDNITSRRNRIFLLLEEIRRLRIQQEIKNAEESRNRAAAAAARAKLGGLPVEEEEEMPEYPSSIPFLPPLKTDTLKEYYITFAFLVASLIIFGGLVAPTLQLRLGMGGTSYEDFIASMHLPRQLSQVDPIVASFTGGAVGVLSALLVVEVNNVKQQEHKRCMYCHGSGYLACARCAATGSLIDVQLEGEGSARGAANGALAAAAEGAGAEGAVTAGRQGMKVAKRCPNCAGLRKVMCPTCLCTGMALATEHDPRINPFE
ncbi:unnamed protein product [Closterium sp. NIES-64]|nr:unnamed protein product [Closterium sp. NIES-64]